MQQTKQRLAVNFINAAFLFLLASLMLLLELVSVAIVRQLFLKKASAAFFFRADPRVTGSGLFAHGYNLWHTRGLGVLPAAHGRSVD
jgi:hypothetical protein